MNPVKMPAPQDPLPHDQDETDDRDGAYVREGLDDRADAYDQDDTYEPYDFLPAAPTAGTGPSPTPWHEDVSRENRWAALKEAATPLEKPLEKPPAAD